MNFCSSCGGALAHRVPEGDNLPRFVCDACGTIHYDNPKNVIGTIPEWEGKILLCRRAIEPRYGYWTLPAGFMENDEHTMRAAERETNEEAHANVDMGPLYMLIDIPHIHQVHMFFRARLKDLTFHSGSESLEVKLFAEEEIPWDDLAFHSVRQALRHYFADRKDGAFRFHHISLSPQQVDHLASDMARFDRMGR